MASMRVALCLLGEPRTFTMPHVAASIEQNLVGALRTQAQLVDALLHMTLSNDHEQDAVRAALAPLSPRLVRLESSFSPDANILPSTGRKCQLPYFMNWPQCRNASLAAVYSACYLEVTAAERADGQQYKHVVVARPDAYWHAPHPPLCNAQSVSTLAAPCPAVWLMKCRAGSQVAATGHWCCWITTSCSLVPLRT